MLPTAISRELLEVSIWIPAKARFEMLRCDQATSSRGFLMGGYIFYEPSNESWKANKQKKQNKMVEENWLIWFVFGLSISLCLVYENLAKEEAFQWVMLLAFKSAHGTHSQHTLTARTHNTPDLNAKNILHLNASSYDSFAWTNFSLAPLFSSAKSDSAIDLETPRGLRIACSLAYGALNMCYLAPEKSHATEVKNDGSCLDFLTRKRQQHRIHIFSFCGATLLSKGSMWIQVSSLSTLTDTINFVVIYAVATWIYPQNLTTKWLSILYCKCQSICIPIYVWFSWKIKRRFWTLLRFYLK